MTASTTTSRGVKAPPSGARTVATAVTEVLAPAHLAIALGAVVAVHASSSAAVGLGWAALVVFFTGVLPYAFILLGVRRGRWQNHHIPDRRQRALPLAFGAASVLAGLGALWAFDAPRELRALVVAQLLGLMVALVVSLVWKVSIHVAVAFGSVAIVVLIFGSTYLLLTAAALAVAWSRLVLRAHTRAQVAGGAAIGTAIAAGVFAALR